MLSPVAHDSSNSVGIPADNNGETSSDFGALRVELAELVGAVGQIVESRAAHAKQVAIAGSQAGLSASRSAIRAYPVTSIAVATLAGASLAIMLTQPRRPTLTARLNQIMPDVSRSDLSDLVRQMQRSASNASQGLGIASAFERVVESVSSIDAKSSLTPAIEKAGAWLSSMRASMTGK